MLFPEPEVPVIATNSPAATPRSTPASTGTRSPVGATKRLREPLRAQQHVRCRAGSLRRATGARCARWRRRRTRRPAAPRRRARRRAGAARSRRAAARSAPPTRRCRARARARARRPLTPPESVTASASASTSRAELQVGGAERALDAEVAHALEHGRGDGVREREPADHERERADPAEQRREERRRLAQLPAQLAGKLHVDALDLVADPAAPRRPDPRRRASRRRRRC